MFGRESISGAILAGGRGQRMDGADKGLITFLGRPLINHVIDVLRPQVGSIFISANRHQQVYAQLGLPVVSDRDGGYSGPLSGIARILEEVTTPFVLIVPCDMPFLPADLAQNLIVALTAHGGEVAIAHGAGRLQPLCILMKRSVEKDLMHYRELGGAKVQEWVLGLQHCIVNFPSCSEEFININTPESLYSAIPVAIHGN